MQKIRTHRRVPRSPMFPMVARNSSSPVAAHASAPRILDAVVLMALVYVPLIFGGVLSYSGEPGQMPHISPVAGLLAFVGFVVWLWFTIVYVARNGQTIAKKWLGIRVVRSDGSQASLGRIFWLRNIVNGLLGIIPLYGLVDILLIFGDSRQCVHDK